MHSGEKLNKRNQSNYASSGRQFNDIFENTQWRKLKRLDPEIALPFDLDPNPGMVIGTFTIALEGGGSIHSTASENQSKPLFVQIKENDSSAR